MAEVFDIQQQWFDSFGSLAVGGLVYYGKPNTDPKIVANQIPVFSDRALTVATQLPNPQTIGADGRVENKPWLGQRYSIQVDDLNGVTIFSSQDNGENPSTGTVLALSNVQGFDAITAETPAGITEYEDQQVFTMRTVGANTGKVTVNIDAVGERALKFNFNEEISPGFFQSGQSITFIYNSQQDNFNWIDSGRGISLLTNVGGTGDAITADGGPSVTGYVDKQIFIFRAKSVNSGAATLKIGTLPVISIKKNNDVELQAGEIQINQDVIVVFNSVLSGGTFQVISQLANQFTIQSKMCIPFFDVIANIPAGYLLCDGTNGTPNLVSRFIKGSDSTGSDIGTLGGSLITGSHILTVSEMPNHNHSFTAPSGTRLPEGDNGPSVVSTTAAATTGNTGGGAGHTHPDTEPPFTNVLWIMKT